MERSAKNTITMGDILYKKLEKKMYSISFTDYENYTNGSSSDSAIEASLEKTGFEYGFINLRDSLKNECLKNIFISRVIGHQELKSSWSNNTDGIFYIKEIKRSSFGK